MSKVGQKVAPVGVSVCDGQVKSRGERCLHRKVRAGLTLLVTGNCVERRTPSAEPLAVAFNTELKYRNPPTPQPQ